MDRIDADLAGLDQRRQACALRAGEGKVDLAGDALVEQRDVFGQGDYRLHHVQVVHSRRIDGGQRLSEKIGLLLVVAFDADTVGGFDDRLQQFDDTTGVDLAADAGRAFEAACAALLPLIPVFLGHARFPCVQVATRLAPPLPLAGEGWGESGAWSVQPSLPRPLSREWERGAEALTWSWARP